MTELRCYTCKALLAPPGPRCPQCDRLALLLGRYLIGAEIGKGGFGTVREAHDIRLGKRCAVKEIPYRSDTRHQVEREVALLVENSRASLPFVPEIYDYHVEPGSYYIIMAYIDGPALSQLMGTPWPAEHVIAFLRTMLGYLVHLHDIGIIHRDISPNNIKRTHDGRYILLDFGIAKRVTEGSSVHAFNHDFAPIEQIKRQGTTERSDLFSLGVTAYRLLTGRLPPDALKRADLESVVAPAHCVPNCPPELDRTILKLMAFSESDRPDDARAAIAMLDEPVTPPVSRVTQRLSTTLRDTSESHLLYRTGQGRVIALAAPPDGRYLALGTPFGVYLYEGSAPEHCRFIPTGEPIHSIGFAHNGTVLFIAERSAVRAVRVADLQFIAGWTTTPAQILALATAQPVDTAVATSGDYVWIWRVAADQPIRLALDCSGLALALDGSVLATVVNGRVELRRPSNGERIAVLPYDDGVCELVALDPLGHLCAVATAQYLAVWRMSDQTRLYRVALPVRQMHALAFAPDGRSLLVAGDASIAMYHASDGRPVGTPWPLQVTPSILCFVDSGNTLATGTASGVAVRSARDGTIVREIRDHADKLHCMACSADGTLLATMGAVVRLYAVDGTTVQLLHEFTYHTERGNTLAFAPDGMLLVAGSSAGITVWRVTDGTLVQTLAVRPMQAGALGVAADGRSLVVLTQALEHWSLADGKQLATVDLDVAALYDIALIPMSTAAVTVDDDAIVVIDLAHAGSVHRVQLPVPGSTVRSLAPAHDGRTMALVTESGLVVWTTDNGRWLTSQARGQRAIWDDAGQRVALVDNDTITLWRLANGELQLVRAFHGHVGAVGDTAFVPHSDLLASVGHDGTLCLWATADDDGSAREG